MVEKMIITITLNPEEQAAFRQLLDAALRVAGIGALDVVVHFKSKLDAVTQQSAAEEAAE